MMRKLFVFLGLICVSLQAMSADAKLQSIKSYRSLPFYKGADKIIHEIVSTTAKKNEIELGLRYKKHLEELGDRIEFTVHPLRFLGAIFSDPELKVCMRTIMRGTWFKWPNFMGSTKRRGVVKNMTREMRKHNIFPHLYGFAQHVNADYDRILYYVEREDYEGLVKYLIKH
ncbi:MAG: hypothetical protein SNF33_04340 [Candidatus Algichlamydia australiensis]|nr:hypothetical protein [Chlamydiales bacterium]